MALASAIAISLLMKNVLLVPQNQMKQDLLLCCHCLKKIVNNNDVAKPSCLPFIPNTIPSLRIWCS